MLAECLAGTRVLDLTQYIPGPFATQWLADLGAEVVKVEPPAGDPMRTMGPVDADGTTSFYKLANRNKVVVRLDLKTEPGKAGLTKLLAAADVLVEAYRPGVLDRLGFSADELARINPRLIHCSLSGYGQTGPHAPVAGHDLTYVALTGGLFASGIAGRPVMTFPPLADHAGAMLAVQGVLAALLRRGRTGKGARLDISLSEAALSWMGGVLTAAHRGGEARREHDIINGGAAFYRIYRTGDGRFVALGAIEEKFWRGFCVAVGREEWIHRQFEPMPQNELIAELEALFLTRTRDDWAALLCPADCCFEPVLEPAEAAHHPQWKERDLIHVGKDKDDVAEVLLPVFLDGARAHDRRPFKEDDVQAVLATWR
ncbi:putative Predicted acyl-CoA transferase/carnitine dehydratase [Magnetospirillum gryphiswaldense MSR-1 v2]|uniref:Predicted acyl-CoA transferase/carnitine dehydratase n=1 Tax=Magnetospirillum gryphiswaldense (strain DSM 6361 / JCM 21280 / NBRC 15271 / MSR-1) TaxID=431944 RepID=V6EYQ3_MAGGM|nr:CoA transferase [Magnetospirillum gryphiswaldense]CDK97353.1 putative Predicted acyl-CoA transferase/carnitine dehydratase [Magnetospirillum gryphiswaldense MSR-1 v2]